MGIKDIFKNMFKTAQATPVPYAPAQVQKNNTEPVRKWKFDYPVADFQWAFVISEVERLNDLLKTLDCTRHLHMDSNALTPDSYFRYEPFTLKTGKISKYPCTLHATSTVYMGYSISVSYDINDKIGKGQINIATEVSSYTIDYKNVNNELRITKVLVSDSGWNYTKIYPKQA